MTSPPSAGESLAGFWPRLWAMLLDSLLLAGIIYPILLSIYGLEYLDSRTPVTGPADFLLVYVFPVLACILFWIYKSATPGKLLLGMRIVDARTGGHPSNAQFVGRYFAYFLSTVPLGLGFFWILWDPHRQGWHDKLAGTLVVRRTRTAQPSA